MNRDELPEALLQLVTDYRNLSSKSVTNWSNREGSIEEQHGFVQESDRFHALAQQKWAEVETYCRDHGIDIALVLGITQ